MFQCIALRLARLSILQMRKRTRPLARSWIRNISNFRVGLQNHRFPSKIQPASVRSLKVSHTLNNIPQRTWTETFRTYHSRQLLSIVWTRIIDGFSIDIAQCTGESTFFKDCVQTWCPSTVPEYNSWWALMWTHQNSGTVPVPEYRVSTLYLGTELGTDSLCAHVFR